MASSGYTAWSVTAGEIPTTAYWNILGYNDASFNTGLGFNDSIIEQRHFDWAGLFQHNMKSAINASAITPGNGSNNFASNGVAVSFTVASNCNAFVTISLGANAASDYEFQPQIYVDGTLIINFDPAAALSTNGRANVRSYADIISLTTGSHTISAGGQFLNGSGYNINATAASIAAIVLGYVTA